MRRSLNDRRSSGLKEKGDLVGPRTHLEPVQGAVIFDQKVLQLVDGKVVAELAQQVGQVHRFHCNVTKPQRSFKVQQDG